MRIAVVLVITACSVPDGDYFGRTDRGEPDHFRWCNQGEPDRLDPAVASSTASTPLVHALFVGLTAYAPDGHSVASLATSWETSDDLRSMTFHLRHDARWTSGRGVTAYDIAYTAIRVANPLTGSPNSDNLQALQNTAAYLSKQVYELRRDVAPYRAGDIVELTAPTDADLAARTASKPLALRDLGASEAAAYATVPPATEVTLVMTTDQRATLPSPDGRPWAYVSWARDEEGVFGWVPLVELDGEPHAGAVLHVRRVDAKNRGADDARPELEVHGSDLLYTPDVLGIRVSDPYTITFECADPTPFMFAMTTNRSLRATPIETVSRWPVRWTRPEHIVTSGPLHLAEWHERDHLELVRSPTYWAPTEVKSARMTVYSMDDQAANSNYYFTGGCDATASNQVPSTYLPVLDGEQRGRPYKDYDVSPYLGIYFVWLQTEKLPDRHLRRALALAIDRTPIPAFTHGGELPTAQLTPGTPIARLDAADLAACGVAHDTPGMALVMAPGELCYVPPPGLDYDLARAKEELALAKDIPKPLHYMYNAGAEAHKQIAEYLQAAWARIGLDVVIEAHEWNSMLADTRAGKFELARLGQIGSVADTESEFLSLFRCGTPDNRGRYCNPDFERLMTEARTMRDRGARNAKLREAEAVMIEDVPVIPIYVYTQKRLTKPYVRDFAINAIDQPPLWRVWIDPSWHP